MTVQSPAAFGPPSPPARRPAALRALLLTRMNDVAIAPSSAYTTNVTPCQDAALRTSDELLPKQIHTGNTESQGRRVLVHGTAALTKMALFAERPSGPDRRFLFYHRSFGALLVAWTWSSRESSLRYDEAPSVVRNPFCQRLRSLESGEQWKRAYAKKNNQKPFRRHQVDASNYIEHG